ncbi:MAG: hypothetical protein BWX54_02227 [Verrucomicrobia bacterium ADurb.Bin018]|nr:MAG: hypothetical protein BWX54_02227 [Verrucomicrobia bacterium ADurb.Bin018]
MRDFRVGHAGGDVQLPGAGPVARGLHGAFEPIRAGVFPHQIVIGHNTPRGRQVNLLTVGGPHHHGAAHLLRRATDQLFDQLHHRTHVAIGFIDLQRGELRIVRAVEPFVAVIFAELEHLVIAAHQQPLQIQLRRDAHVHGLPQRVVERLERRGDGAARQRLQHGGLHLEIAARLQKAADERQNTAAGVEHPAHLRVGNQIQVALAVAHFGVLQPVPFFRQRMQRLGQQFPLRHLQRLLTGARGEQLARHADKIAQVNRLECGERFLAQRVFLQVDLEFVGAVLQVRERAFAHLTNRHHAPGGLNRPTFGERRPDFRQRAGTRKSPAIGRVARRLKRRQIRQPLLAKFLLVCTQFHDGLCCYKLAHPTRPPV